MLTKQSKILVDFDHTLFNTNKFINLVKGDLNTRVEFKDFLYPDALEFISYASKCGRLVLFSEGDIDFQKEKIKKTKLDKLFKDGIEIYSSYAKMNSLKKYSNKENLVLIDDNPKIIDEAVSMGLKAIRVKRGKFKSFDSKQKPEYTVASLKDIMRRDLLQKMNN